MIKVQYSNNYEAKRSRIKRLPKIMKDVVTGLTKRDILMINKTFHDGIKNDTLRLERLSGLTVTSKKRSGMPHPSRPLYGRGDSEGNRSYMNMMEVSKDGNSWRLQPSKRMHHSGNLSLKDLFTIHEHGAIVRMQTEEGIKLIQIPPRPALLLSYRRWLITKRKDKREQSKEVRKAMTEYINEGSQEKLNIWSTFQNRLTEKSEELF